jgi:hypothetical protein
VTWKNVNKGKISKNSMALNNKIAIIFSCDFLKKCDILRNEFTPQSLQERAGGFWVMTICLWQFGKVTIL